VVEIGGERFRCLEVLKHDSWAASGIYASATRKAFCEFNRQQAVACLPMRWLGRLLADREQAFHRRLEDVEGIPASLGPVRVAGRVLPHAVAREFITGHALREGEHVGDHFFSRFRRMLAEVHARGVAHVDLHKRENILVDDAGHPHLIDFQISFACRADPACRRRSSAGSSPCSSVATTTTCSSTNSSIAPTSPASPAPTSSGPGHAWIRAHRMVAVPFRTFRRNLLVRLGIRSASGHAFSEAFPEIAHRRAA